jgi:hypothetical protein
VNVEVVVANVDVAIVDAGATIGTIARALIWPKPATAGAISTTVRSQTAIGPSAATGWSAFAAATGTISTAADTWPIATGAWAIITADVRTIGAAHTRPIDAGTRTSNSSLVSDPWPCV